MAANKRTFEEFKERMEKGVFYPSLLSAHRGISMMTHWSEKDRNRARQLAEDYFSSTKARKGPKLPSSSNAATLSVFKKRLESGYYKKPFIAIRSIAHMRLLSAKEKAAARRMTAEYFSEPAASEAVVSEETLQEVEERNVVRLKKAEERSMESLPPSLRLVKQLQLFSGGELRQPFKHLLRTLIELDISPEELYDAVG